MNKDTFGTFIAAARKEKGLTQQKLANQLHVTDKAVSKWERGLSYPDLTLMEALADALDLSVTELITCQRLPEAAEENTAVRSLLDISGSALAEQRKKIWSKAAVLLLILLSVVAGILYASANVSQTCRQTIAMKEAVGADYYIYIENTGRLLQLQCPDQETYETIKADGLSEYTVQYTWNHLTRKGSVESCIPEDAQVLLGGIMDQVGASIDFGSALGVDCVWQEFQQIYPDPDRERQFLFTYGLWYVGDGSDYFADGAEHPLVTIRNCRSICGYDYDDDGIVEVFVLTRYDDAPYMLCELDDGAVVQTRLASIPDHVAEIFRQDASPR